MSKASEERAARKAKKRNRLLKRAARYEAAKARGETYAPTKKPKPGVRRNK